MLKKNFNHTSRFLRCDEKFRLMIPKGVYPYEYMDDWEKLEVTSLPPKDVFYSRLSIKCFSDQDYEHAQQVWNTKLGIRLQDAGLLSRYLLKNRRFAVGGCI